MSLLANKALEIAISRIGMKENPIGSNWGFPVQDWLARVGIKEPAPWCMAFAWTCVDDAARALGIANPLPRTGGVMDMYHRMQKSTISGLVRDPQPGDIFLMDLSKNYDRSGPGHCGFVEKGSLSAEKMARSIGIYTIDGNTNAEGGREGFEVERKLRYPRKPIIGYLRY